MKKISYILCICCAAATVSCLDDKDGVADKNIESVLAVTGIPPDERTLYLGDYLELTPEITFSEGAQLSDYTYRWVLATEQIGQEKELNWQVSIPGGYKYNESINGVFIVGNTRTGLEFRKTFRVRIENTLTPMWMAIYRTPDGTIDWMSMQGAPENFTRFFAGMNELVNGGNDPIEGNFRGAMTATSEFMIFTDHAPDYGWCVSLVVGDAEMPQDIGQKSGPINGRVYNGAAAPLDLHSIRFCEGGTKYLIMNDNLYAFDGTNKRLPVFNDEAFLKAVNVADVMASSHFMRFKKANLIRYKDNTLSCFHAFNLDEDFLCDETGAEKLKLDELYGMFAESTALTSNKPYNIYIAGRRGVNTNLYEYSINNISNTFQKPVWVKTIPIPRNVADNAIAWYGAFSQKYGFYTTRNAIYKFDYLNIASFEPELFKSYDPKYEIVEVFPLPVGSGLNNNEYGTMVYLYDAAKNTTSMHFFHTVSGEPLEATNDGFYEDAIPGRGLEFLKR